MGKASFASPQKAELVAGLRRIAFDRLKGQLTLKERPRQAYPLSFVTIGREALLRFGFGGGVLKVDHCIRLWAFLSFNDVKIDHIAFFERFIPIRLNR